MRKREIVVKCPFKTLNGVCPLPRRTVLRSHCISLPEACRVHGPSTQQDAILELKKKIQMLFSLMHVSYPSIDLKDRAKCRLPPLEIQDTRRDGCCSWVSWIKEYRIVLPRKVSQELYYEVVIIQISDSYLLNWEWNSLPEARIRHSVQTSPLPRQLVNYIARSVHIIHTFVSTHRKIP